LLFSATLILLYCLSRAFVSLGLCYLPMLALISLESWQADPVPANLNT